MSRDHHQLIAYLLSTGSGKGRVPSIFYGITALAVGVLWRS